MNARRVLYPTDFSEPSQIAFDYALRMAAEPGAKIIVFHAVETLGPENVTYGEAVSNPQPHAYHERLMDDLRKITSSRADLAFEYVLSEEEPASAILAAAAKYACDLIVMGTHGRHGLQRFLHGSVTEQVIRGADCPVLVVKSPRVAPLEQMHESPQCGSAARLKTRPGPGN